MKRPGFDIWIVVAVGVGYGAVAITAMIAVVMLLVTEQDWRGDFAWFGAKCAGYAAVSFVIWNIDRQNRRLKARLSAMGVGSA